jgi:PPM family protein phosphatase
MSLPDCTSEYNLNIHLNAVIQIENFQIEITEFITKIYDVFYFKVDFRLIDNSNEEDKQAGLLRIGKSNGSLSRELKLRESLNDYKMVSRLLVNYQSDSVDVSIHPVPKYNYKQEIDTDLQEDFDIEESLDIDSVEHLDTIGEAVNQEPPSGIDLEKSSDNIDNIKGTIQPEDPELQEKINLEKILDRIDNIPATGAESLIDDEYLTEEYYDEDLEMDRSSGTKLILLSNLPNPDLTLSTYLQQDISLTQALVLTSQICQLFRYVYQRQWCLLNIYPDLIEIGTPIQFFDLTSAFPAGEILDDSFITDYSAPEISYVNNISIEEQLSTYTIGKLLYHLTHHQLPDRQSISELQTVPNIQPIPQIYQILKTCLSPVTQERFPLAQLLHLLVSARQYYQTPSINWEVAHLSTTGLSLQRLQNEDSYGYRQQSINSTSLIIALVADGMGGMAQGEIASKIAVETVTTARIPDDLTTPESRQHWLNQIIEAASSAIAEQTHEAGTTISIILGWGHELNIAHVGDSRIFLLRKNCICQLSEDHSLVAMLLASDRISYSDSIDHPDRNVLLKSIGSKKVLNSGYIQNLECFYERPAIGLEDGDIILICSDGVWDLVNADELAQLFSKDISLAQSVRETIDKILARSAPDNGTILALKYQIELPTDDY